MTREEIKKAMSDTKKEVVLKNLHKLLSLVEGYSEYEDCVGYAIEKLEQEPTTKIEESNFSQEQYKADLQSAYDCGKSVIDKIRAEIIQSIQNGTIKIEDGNEELFRILDKYKTESEET